MPESTRPASSPVVAGAQNAIVANIATIVAWLLGVGLVKLAIEVPPDVRGALDFLMLTAIAFGVGWISSRRRNEQWSEERQVTGLRKVL